MRQRSSEHLKSSQDSSSNRRGDPLKFSSSITSSAQPKIDGYGQVNKRDSHWPQAKPRGPSSDRQPDFSGGNCDVEIRLHCSLAVDGAAVACGSPSGSTRHPRRRSTRVFSACSARSRYQVRYRRRRESTGEVMERTIAFVALIALLAGVSSSAR